MLKRKRSDAERRARQASKFVRIILVHRKLGSLVPVLSADEADRVAKELKVSQRTVYRDWKVLKEAYGILGTSLLDGA